MAREILARRPDARLVVIDKQTAVAQHQTGHNSGVIHSGIYYTPGSLKARLCVEGARLMYEYCDEHAIPYERCGKLVVALDDDELPRLDALEARARANGVPGPAAGDGGGDPGDRARGAWAQRPALPGDRHRGLRRGGAHDRA